MSLRARLLVGLIVLVGVVVAAGVLVLALQRDYLIGQVDSRLARQSANVVGDAGAGAGWPRRAGQADLYVGILAAGRLTAVGTPDSDPGLSPILEPTPALDTPTTVAATGGSAQRMRVLLTATSIGTLVVGRSLAEVEATVADLRASLVVVGLVLLGVLALVFWWMRTLGLDPILRVTRVARAITAGDALQRVEPFPPRTEAQALGAAFNRLVEANEASTARLRQFIADASHELRTPLVTLKGYAALHGAGGITDRDATADALRRIRQEANRMGRLVDELLLLAELDAGAPPVREPVDVVAILRDLADDMRVLDPLRQVTLHVPAKAVVAGDRDRLTQVFSALTSNVLRHTPPGTAVELSVRPDGGGVRIDVVDHGPGIAADDQAKVFDRFYRTDATRARASGGSGLGLAIAAGIVHAHAGQVGVSSRPDEGTTFWVQLPAAEIH